MSSLPTPPRLGPRVPLPPPPKARDGSSEGSETSPDELVPGDLLEGRYQIEERIGEGGVGIVYRALQLKLHRRVAVKLLQQDVVGEEELRPRFQQEALTLAALSHPNIVSLTDYGVVRGRPFLVMELLEGRTLREILDAEGALEPVRALTLLRQVVLALAYAHALGIVHRDLKPANMIVQAFPAHEHVKVLDFGMVKLLPGSYLDRGEQLTRIGFTFGTPAYMSPEHAMGGDVDGRSDLYAVGVLLFELLTGEKPFDGEIQDILRHHLSSPVPRLQEKRAELAEFVELQQIVERAMAKEREERFESAGHLLKAIDELLMSGLLAEVAEDEALPDEDAEGRGSITPRMREALEHAASALSGYARTSREVWRDKASPQLARANRELRALAARLAPRLRGISEAAWAELRPRIAQAAERISRLALEAKHKLESSAQHKPPALPADTQAQAPSDATIVDVPTFAGSEPAGEAEVPPEAGQAVSSAPSTPRSVAESERTQFGEHAPGGGGLAPTIGGEARAESAALAATVVGEPRTDSGALAATVAGEARPAVARPSSGASVKQTHRGLPAVPAPRDAGETAEPLVLEPRKRDEPSSP